MPAEVHSHSPSPPQPQTTHQKHGSPPLAPRIGGRPAGPHAFQPPTPAHPSFTATWPHGQERTDATLTFPSIPVPYSSAWQHSSSPQPSLHQLGTAGSSLLIWHVTEITLGQDWVATARTHWAYGSVYIPAYPELCILTTQGFERRTLASLMQLQGSTSQPTARCWRGALLVGEGTLPLAAPCNSHCTSRGTIRLVQTQSCLN